MRYDPEHAFFDCECFEQLTAFLVIRNNMMLFWVPVHRWAGSEELLCCDHISWWFMNNLLRSQHFRCIYLNYLLSNLSLFGTAFGISSCDWNLSYFDRWCAGIHDVRVVQIGWVCFYSPACIMENWSSSIAALIGAYFDWLLRSLLFWSLCLTSTTDVLCWDPSFNCEIWRIKLNTDQLVCWIMNASTRANPFIIAGVM